MTDVGQIHYCLGFLVTRDASGSDVSVYKVKDSPAESVDMLKRFRESKSHVIVYPYRELIGSLMYVTTVSRPDIANVVRILSKFIHKRVPVRSCKSFTESVAILSWDQTF